MKRRHRKKRFKEWRKWNEHENIIPHPNYKWFSVDFTDSGYSVITMMFNKNGEIVFDERLYE